MEAHLVVEGFDVVEGDGLGFDAGGRAVAVEALGLEGGKEAFHGGVVVGIAGAAHAGFQAVGLQQAAVFGTGILAAAITVVEQTAGGAALGERHLQCG